MKGPGPENRKLNAARIGIALAAAGMIAYGVFRGEMSVVLTKAVNICFECIGLG